MARRCAVVHGSPGSNSQPPARSSSAGLRLVAVSPRLGVAHGSVHCQRAAGCRTNGSTFCTKVMRRAKRNALRMTAAVAVSL